MTLPSTPKRAGKKPKPGSAFLSEVVANNLRAARSLQRMSQVELARRMAWLGHEWSRATVSEVERMGRSLTLDEFLAAALIVGAHPIELLLPQGAKLDIGGNLNPVNRLWMDAWLSGKFEVVQANPEDEGVSLLIYERLEEGN